MTYVSPKRWWWPVLAYLAGGALIGLTLPLLKGYYFGTFGRAGFAVAYVVNVGMPLLVVALAATYPRMWVALLGTACATTAFLLLTGGASPNPLTWPATLGAAATSSPIMFVACVMYHVLAALTVVIVSPFRRVSSPPDPLRCPGCGYSLIGLVEPRCPECFRPVTLQSAGQP